MRANSQLQIGPSLRLGTLGSQEWKFSRGKFTRNGIAEFLVNLCGATKASSRGFIFGQSNGRLRGCFQELPRVFTCTHPAFLTTMMLQIGYAVCISIRR